MLPYACRPTYQKRTDASHSSLSLSWICILSERQLSLVLMIHAVLFALPCSHAFGRLLSLAGRFTA
jgi:hypothetical protein